MSISPRYAGQKILSGSNTIELYLDYVCPFSKKLFNKLYDEIIPQTKDKDVTFIFRHQVQPWHPSSTLVHEAGIAVSLLAPEKFWEFSKALFAESESYYDEPTYNETRSQTYQRLAALAHKSVGVDKQQFLKLVEITKPGNAGNALGPDLKAFIKVARQNSIHASPTVVINGVTDGSFESSTPVETWLKKIDEVVSASVNTLKL